MSNIESYLRIHGAIPSDDFSSLDKTTESKTETKHTIKSAINHRTANAEKVEGGTEQNEKCLGHHKASTALKPKELLQEWVHHQMSRTPLFVYLLSRLTREMAI